MTHSTCLHRVLFAAWIASVFLCAGAWAGDADVALWDRVLARVPAGAKYVDLGDMRVPVATARMWRDQVAGVAPEGPHTDSASQTGVNKWTGGNVFYQFNANVSAPHRTAFRDACAEWSTFAALTFTEGTGTGNYIMVNDGGSGLSGGNSLLGMGGGSQALNIGSSSWNRGTLDHEIGHALGLIHEHQRSDRDSFVTILTANIIAGSESNFTKVPTSTNNGLYDFLSVMHYTRNAFSKPPGSLDTIQPLPAYAQYANIMGNNPDRVLSRPDRLGIGAMYGAGPVLDAVVTNTKDSGAGSLRAAIYYALDFATDHPGSTTTISFNIPMADAGFSGGVFTITPTAQLPTPGPGTVIDATTQTAFTGNTNTSGPEVELSGASAQPPDAYAVGFRLSEANCTVRGLVINGFPENGVLMTGPGATGNTVSGCYIGTNAAGTAAVPNAFHGVLLDETGGSHTIGGTTVADRNIISGNTYDGVDVSVGTGQNVISGNYIGLNAAGTGPVPNGRYGVIVASTNGNMIGGSAPGAGNVISGNGEGVLIADDDVHDNVVAGNLIGLNAAGTGAVPNGVGVEIGNAQSNTVGGATAAARNVISGNTYQGILLDEGGGTDHTRFNVIIGNYIGTNAAGTAAVPNGFAGVEIFDEATSNTIGGTVPGAGNVISGNAAQGVAIHDKHTGGNTIAGNLIGLDATGTVAVANGFSGIEIWGGARFNIIGGTVAGARNVISGNTFQGIIMHDAGTSGNYVAGNLIGLNATGDPIPNQSTGVVLYGGAQSNTIGGSTAAERNIISSNNNGGFYLADAGTSGNVVAGNYIGTDPSGTSYSGNGSYGGGIFNGATGNTIGGTVAGSGNVISGNGGYGLLISDAGTNNNLVAGNFIGVDVTGTGTVFLANSLGVYIASGAKNNTIGGTTAEARNVISGNFNGGVVLASTGTTGNIVAGNYIGTDAAGAAAHENNGAGIGIYDGAAENMIGGTAPGAGNVISGNTSGVFLDNGANGNVVAGNLIGLNAAGLLAIPNTRNGVAIFGGSSGNIIGAPGGGRNYIAGNNGDNVVIAESNTNGNVIQGNTIGLGMNGATIPNVLWGIHIFGNFSFPNPPGPVGTIIGGTTPGAANIISGHPYHGIIVTGFDATGNTISGNSIYGNGMLGINLEGPEDANSVNPNDAGDGDNGANNGQNYPVLASAVLGIGTTITGTFNSTASATFRVEFFASATADPSGYGEGQNFIGATDVSTDGSGNTTINVVLPATIPAGQRITSTATSASGDTSEFSQNVTVTTTDTDGDGLPDVYEMANGLNVNVNDAALDADGDGMTNLAEFRAGTDPKSPTSVLRLGPPTFVSGNAVVNLPSLTGRTYRIEYADDLVVANPWRFLADQIAGTGATIPITDPGAATLPKRFYRAVVEP